jgi:hypothetical protein
MRSGRVRTTRPSGFGLYAGHNRKQKKDLPPGQMFVSCSEDYSHGYIVTRDSNSDETYVVITTLSRAGVRR